MVGNFRERRVLFKDGRDVDFSFLLRLLSSKCLNSRFQRKSLWIAKSSCDSFATRCLGGEKS